MNVDLLPQFDRAKIKTSVGFYDTLLRLHDMERESVIPAIVKEYDRKTGKAKVLPIVKRLGDSVDGTEVEMLRPEVEVNVIRTIRGGFCVDIPLFKGDTGWLVAGDRNAKTAIEKNSAILTEDDSEDSPKNEGPQKPDDFDIGKFQYGLFIPASWAELELDESDDGKLVFSNVDKSCKITVDKDGNINVIANKIDIDAEADFQQDSHFHMNVDIEGMLDVEGDVDIGGNETVNGNSTIHGNLTVDGEVDIGKNDHAKLLETEIVTKYNSETKQFETWKGKIVRTNGAPQSPITAAQIVQDGGGGAGGGVSSVNASGSIVLYAHNGSSVRTAVLNIPLEVNQTTGDVIVRFRTGSSVTNYATLPDVIKEISSIGSGVLRVTKTDGTINDITIPISTTGVTDPSLKFITGAVYDTTTHTFKLKYRTMNVQNGLITSLTQEQTDSDSNAIFTATPHVPEVQSVEP